MWSDASELLTSRPRMNTPVFPRRTGSLRARGHGPYRDESGVEGQSKLCVFLSCCRLPEEKEEQEEVEEQGEEGARLAEEWRRGRRGVQRSDASSEETLRNRRCRRGVCCEGRGEGGVCCGGRGEGGASCGGVEGQEEAGEEVTLSSGGLEGVSRPIQSPDRVLLLRGVKPLLWAESERRLWAESRVRIAASIFLSNIFLVS